MVSLLAAKGKPHEIDLEDNKISEKGETLLEEFMTKENAICYINGLGGRLKWV